MIPVPKDEETGHHKCPYCGQPLKYESGCDICKNCGYSNCGWLRRSKYEHEIQKGRWQGLLPAHENKLQKVQNQER